jgi:anti-anti-sigma factor
MLQVMLEAFQGAPLLSVAGNISHLNAQEFEDRLLSLLRQALGQGPVTLLDLGGLDYISSAGLRVLMMASRLAKKEERAIRVCGLSSRVAEIFAISRFNLVFDCFDSREQALAGARTPS